jgi:hypothetical protein
MCSRADDPTTYAIDDRNVRRRGPLGPALDEASNDEIQAAVRIVHVAGASQRRLLGAWNAADRVVEPGFPVLLAAVCLELHVELEERHVALGPCPACRRTIAGPSGDSAAQGPGLGSNERPKEALA